MLTTIVEVPEFIKRAEKLPDENNKNDLIDYLAAHPKAGSVIQETGGIRKIRWKREGMGKSGGVRVIYYYHDESIPLFLLSIFGKNEKENLSKSERNELSKLTKLIVKSYSRGKNE